MMHLTIARVNEHLYEGDAYSVHLPGVAGEFEVLAHHEPLIATLKKGTVTVRLSKEGSPKKFEIEKGVIEVSNNRAIVLL